MSLEEKIRAEKAEDEAHKSGLKHYFGAFSCLVGSMIVSPYQPVVSIGLCLTCLAIIYRYIKKN